MVQRRYKSAHNVVDKEQKRGIPCGDTDIESQKIWIDIDSQNCLLY